MQIRRQNPDAIPFKSITLPVRMHPQLHQLLVPERVSRIDTGSPDRLRDYREQGNRKR